MMTDFTLTLLADNYTTRRGLLGEHGLSYWIELDGRKILFDTGQGYVLQGNASKLGVPLEKTDTVILSHGHFDHTGALAAVMKKAPQARILAHPAAPTPKFSRVTNGEARDIGMSPEDIEALHSSPEWTRTVEPVEVGGGLYVTGQIPRRNTFEDVGGPFFTDSACTHPDALPDDQAAFMESREGIVVMLGCAHAGVINTLDYIRELTGKRSIHTVIGGMHLVSATIERMRRTTEDLRLLNVKRLLPTHCTGFAATVQLHMELPGRCEHCAVGTVLRMEL
jgi:7,8-dihydropterin-6-yl-methyl-4-(beta-D-ribofuranosyl)aminobenzene 5'-phosphate synthase